jgi:hypothetical protein
MIKRYIYTAFLALLFLCSSHNFSYFYQASVADGFTEKQSQKQCIVYLYDYHLKTHPANKAQRVYLDTLLKRCAALKGKLIVEDLSSVNNDGRMICCNFGINSEDGVLAKLANKARSMGISVDNIEYRYCRVAAVGPLLSNIKANPQTFRSSATIKSASLYKEIMGEVDKIKKYDDGKQLNSLYKRTIALVSTALSKMKLNNQESVADYCKKLKSKDYRQELEKLCIFDSALIDMNIIHALAQCTHEPLILVIAGGSHIDQVIKFIEPMGGKIVLKTAPSTSSALKKVFNSADSATSFTDTHPQPLDMRVLDKFIP